MLTPISQPQPQKSASSSAARVRAAVGKEARAFQLYRIKFANGESVRKRLFDELQDHNDKLEKLLDSSDRDAHLVVQRTAAAEGAAIDAAVCSFWIQARRLFRALANSWDCRCQNHGADLLLQHRTSKKPDFSITFTKLQTAPACWHVQRTRILQDAGPALAGDAQTTAAALSGPSIALHEPGHRHGRAVKSAFRGSRQTTNTTTTTTIVEIAT